MSSVVVVTDTVCLLHGRSDGPETCAPPPGSSAGGIATRGPSVAARV